jgi:hypothetical protein
MPKAKSTPLPKNKPARVKKIQPKQEEIALRAYLIYLERNGAAGNPAEDWLRAEAELTAAPKKPSRKSKVVSIAA